MCFIAACYYGYCAVLCACLLYCYLIDCIFFQRATPGPLSLRRDVFGEPVLVSSPMTVSNKYRNIHRHWNTTLNVIHVYIYIYIYIESNRIEPNRNESTWIESNRTESNRIVNTHICIHTYMHASLASTANADLARSERGYYTYYYTTNNYDY